MEFLFKAVAQVGKVVISLRVLLGPGGLCLLFQLRQIVGTQILQPLFSGQNIHCKFFVVLGVQLVHLVKHRHVLHQGNLVVFQHLDNLLHVDLGPGIVGLHGLQLVFLLLEKAANPLFLRLPKGFQLHHQRGQGLPYLAQVFCLYVA